MLVLQIVGTLWLGNPALARQIWRSASSRCFASYAQFRLHSTLTSQVRANAVSAPIAAGVTDLEPLRAYFRMRDEGGRPSVGAVLDALNVCGMSKDLQTGRRICSDVVENGDLGDVSVGNSLIDMYARCGSMGDARAVFDKMPRRDLSSWHGLIVGYAQNGEYKLALEAFSRMCEEGCVAARETLLAVVRACASLGEKEQGRLVDGKLVKVESLEKGKFLHSQAVKSGYEQDVFVANALMEMFAKCGSVEDANGVFEKLEQRDVVSWNNIILGNAQCGKGDVGLQIYQRMKTEGSCTPNPGTLLAALRACCDLSEREQARLLEKKLVKYETLKKGKAIHTDVTAAGCDKDLYVANTLIEMYARCGSMVDARAIFDKMVARDVVTWNYILTGYGQNSEPEQALQLYQRMREEGRCVPNFVTFVAALRACVTPLSLEVGRRIHDDVRKAGLQTHPAVVTSLVEFYARCGSVPDAQQVFDSVPKHSLPAWNALMAGYKHKGDVQSVRDIFDRMLREGLQPNGETFISLLGACIKGVLVNEGKQYLQAMQQQHGISPTPAHYMLMIELLGRANLLDEAVAFIKGLSCKVDTKMWMTLLAACRQWKNATLGRQVFETILRMDDKHQGAYALMSEIFASVGMREEAQKLDNMRRAWRRNRNENQHPQSEQINGKLAELASRMPPDSKFFSMEEDSACGHSERLALGCALINTEPGTLVRIVKNLRVCDDCHEFFSIVSKLEERTLICRDANRFHTFKDGKCSCGDFW